MKSYTASVKLGRNESYKEFYFLHGISRFKNVATLPKGTSFGELSLVFSKPRAASVIASSELHCFSLSKTDFHIIFKKPIADMNFKQTFFQRFFPSYLKEKLNRLTYDVDEKRFACNHRIFEKGEKARKIFFIKSGSVKLMLDLKKEKNELEKDLENCGSLNLDFASIGEQQIFGLDFLFNKKQRTRNFTAYSSSNDT